MKIQKLLGVAMVVCGMAALILLGDLAIGCIFFVCGLTAIVSRKKVLI